MAKPFQALLLRGYTVASTCCQVLAQSLTPIAPNLNQKQWKSDIYDNFMSRVKTLSARDHH